MSRRVRYTGNVNVRVTQATKKELDLLEKRANQLKKRGKLGDPYQDSRFITRADYIRKQIHLYIQETNELLTEIEQNGISLTNDKNQNEE